jgi:hypothetical protein
MSDIINCESGIDVQKICSFVAHHNMLIVDNYLPASLSPKRWLVMVGATLISSSEATSCSEKSILDYIDTIVQDTSFVLFQNVTICKDCITESTAWCCCKFQQFVKIHTLEHLQCKCGQAAKFCNVYFSHVELFWSCICAAETSNFP